MYKQELNTAIWAANEAAKVIRKYAKEESFDIDVKGKNDLVTTADLASEKIILDMIKKEFADDQFLAEESSDYKELPDGRVWIIDPIDGTTNFSHGFYPYCVSIALWENGEPKVGIVLEVTRNELFWAVEGEGAYLLDEKITISKESDPAKALLSTGFP